MDEIAGEALPASDAGGMDEGRKWLIEPMSGLNPDATDKVKNGTNVTRTGRGVMMPVVCLWYA